MTVAGRAEGGFRYMAYWGGAPRYTDRIRTVAEAGYPGIDVD